MKPFAGLLLCRREGTTLWVGGGEATLSRAESAPKLLFSLNQVRSKYPRFNSLKRPGSRHKVAHHLPTSSSVLCDEISGGGGQGFSALAKIDSCLMCVGKKGPEQDLWSRRRLALLVWMQGFFAHILDRARLLVRTAKWSLYVLSWRNPLPTPPPPG